MALRMRARGLWLVAPESPGHSTGNGQRLRAAVSRSLSSALPKTATSHVGGLLWIALWGPPAGVLGWMLAGPAGVLVGVSLAAWAPHAVRQRRAGERKARLERQLAEVVETCSLAVRAGLSIAQALEFAANEADGPIDQLLRRLIEEQGVGEPFDVAFQHFGEAVGTEDAHLFVLVVTTHARSGGNLAGALDEVATTITHRFDVRRELRALSAQGRVSGAILGALPIAFFFVLAATSHRELGPVYRSAAGIAMVSAGLVMEAAAYVWIRRLMRVEA